MVCVIFQTPQGLRSEATVGLIWIVCLRPPTAFSRPGAFRLKSIHYFPGDAHRWKKMSDLRVVEGRGRGVNKTTNEVVSDFYKADVKKVMNPHHLRATSRGMMTIRGKITLKYTNLVVPN